MNQNYETVLVFDPDLGDAAVQTEMDKVESTIKEHSGNVSNVQMWGKRQLAYPIQKKEYGTYAHVLFEGDNTVVATLDRQFQINEAVIRHLVVKKDKFAPDSEAILKDNASEHENEAGDTDKRDASSKE